MISYGSVALAVASNKVTQQLRKSEKQRVVLGSGGLCEAGWIATDIDVLNVLSLEDWQYYFRPGVIDALLAEHVGEHLRPEDGLMAARICYKYLKPGGYLRAAVPDGFLLMQGISTVSNLEVLALGQKIMRYFTTSGHWREYSGMQDLGWIYSSVLMRREDFITKNGLLKMA